MKKTAKKEDTKLDKSGDLKPKKIAEELTENMISNFLNDIPKLIYSQLLKLAQEKYKEYYKLYSPQEIFDPESLQKTIIQKVLSSSFPQLQNLIQLYEMLSRVLELSKSFAKENPEKNI